MSGEYCIEAVGKPGIPNRTMLRCRIFHVLTSLILWSGLLLPASPQSGVSSKKNITAIVHFLKGANAQREGDMNGALEEYQQAVNLDNQFAEAFNNMGTIFFQKNNSGKAIEFYEKALNLHDDFAIAHNNMGTAYARQAYRMNVSQFYRRAIVHLQKLQLHSMYLQKHQRF